MIPNHPSDEHLAALAGADPEATGDAALSRHVDACRQCGSTVDDLRTLRAALAELPDLRPMRPLRLIPPAEPVAPAFADRLAALVRRAFAPVLTAGAALALVGMVGTVAPGLGAGGDAAMEQVSRDQSVGDAAGEDGSAATDPPEEADGLEEPAVEPDAADQPLAASPDDDVERTEDGEIFGAAAEDESPDATPDARLHEQPATAAGTDAADVDDGRARALADPPAQRSPWPMVLFSGVALIVGAVLLRWILVPRAG